MAQQFPALSHTHTPADDRSVPKRNTTCVSLLVCSVSAPVAAAGSSTSDAFCCVTRSISDTAGRVLSYCKSGRWQNVGKTTWKVGGTFTVWPGQTQDLGRFKLCINTYRIDGREMALTQLIPTDAPDADGNMNWRAYNGTQYYAYYMGIHCFI
ncbi:hypothetical protein IH92_14285 [Salmonella enterica]|nr:hypothetical protein [Salmonella enterica]